MEMENFPANLEGVELDTSQQDFEERKKDIVVYKNVKQGKPKSDSFTKWIADMFFSGRTTKDIVKDLVENQIVPQMKDNIRNTIVSFIDMLFDKNFTIGSSPSSTPPSSFVTNYVSFSDPKPSNKALEENKKKDQMIINSGYETPMFRDRATAERFISDMKAYATKYTRMTVFDCAWMQNKTIDYTWNEWGWDKEEILNIKYPVRTKNREYPYAVVMPKAHQLT